MKAAFPTWTVLAACIACALVPLGRSYGARPDLTEVARVYSLGVGVVRCPTRAEWNADFGSSVSSAYTNLRDDYTVLGPPACEGARALGDPLVPAWKQALGALTLVHEAFHLRHWRFRKDEGKVECQAMVYFKDGAQRLGATAEQAEDLYVYALALHARQVRLFPRYGDRSCKLPPWNPPPLS
jgi:hypothetical protein